MKTITMPLSEYEEMKKEIERLKEKSVFNFVDVTYEDYENLVGPKVKIDTDNLISFVEKRS